MKEPMDNNSSLAPVIPTCYAAVMEFLPGYKKAYALVMVDNGREFLLLKKKDGFHKGQYVPLGGHIEPFETPLQAALREVREESGISLQSARLGGILTETSPIKFNCINYCYHAVVPVDTQFAPLEDEGTLEWIPYSRLKELSTPPTDLAMYQDVFNKRFFVYDVLYDKDLNMLRMTDEMTGKIVAGGSDSHA